MTVVGTVVPMPGTGAVVEAFGDMWVTFLTLTFSGSYVTGGDAFDPTPFFPAGIGAVICVDISGGAGNSFEYDKANKKLKCFSAPNTELAAGAYNAALTGDINTIAQVFAK